jgi:hypothetical protein
VYLLTCINHDSISFPSLFLYPSATSQVFTTITLPSVPSRPCPVLIQYMTVLCLGRCAFRFLFAILLPAERQAPIQLLNIVTQYTIHNPLSTAWPAQQGLFPGRNSSQECRHRTGMYDVTLFTGKGLEFISGNFASLAPDGNKLLSLHLPTLVPRHANCGSSNGSNSQLSAIDVGMRDAIHQGGKLGHCDRGARPRGDFACQRPNIYTSMACRVYSEQTRDNSVAIRGRIRRVAGLCRT